MKAPKFRDKAAKEFHKQATALGWELVRCNKHPIYAHPQVAERIVVGCSASDHRALKNNLKRLQRLTPAAA